MSIDDLGLTGAAEYNAFSEIVRQRIAARCIAESVEYPTLRGWWSERDTPPDADALSWPMAGYRWPQPHN